jgi:hypothetical protein
MRQRAGLLHALRCSFMLQASLGSCALSLVRCTSPHTAHSSGTVLFLVLLKGAMDHAAPRRHLAE